MILAIQLRDYSERKTRSKLMPQDEKNANRLWGIGRNAFNVASFRANQYKQVVQKRIDLGAIQKKIDQLHTEVGQRVGELYLAHHQNPLADAEVGRLLERLSSLKQAALLLEEEIEQIRTEASPTAQDSDRERENKLPEED
jgi:hypothetical protein